MIRTTTLGWSAALLASTLLIAACGGSTTGATSGPPQNGGPTATASRDSGGAAAGDACALVTKAEVSTVAGFEVATASGGHTWGAACAFQAADPSKVFYVTTYNGANQMAPMLQIESGSARLDGIGTDAFWVQTGVLFARNGDHAFAFMDPDLSGLGATTAGATPGAAPDALVQLAKTALGRLG